MPPSASSKRPTFCAIGAGEGALLVAEQLALEQVRGMAAQLSLTNARPRRELSWWIARAISSLPVPVSPWIEHGGIGGGHALDLLEHALQRGDSFR